MLKVVWQCARGWMARRSSWPPRTACRRRRRSAAATTPRSCRGGEARAGLTWTRTTSGRPSISGAFRIARAPRSGALAELHERRLRHLDQADLESRAQGPAGPAGGEPGFAPGPRAAAARAAAARAADRPAGGCPGGVIPGGLAGGVVGIGLTPGGGAGGGLAGGVTPGLPGGGGVPAGSGSTSPPPHWAARTRTRALQDGT